MKKLKRICITVKDIMVITGYSETTSRKLYNAAKKYLNKEKHQLLTFNQFLRYYDIHTSKNQRKKKLNLSEMERLQK